jgi:hypothetical protein
MDKATLTSLIPVIVPMAVYALKIGAVRFSASIKPTWLPLLAAGLGVLADWLINQGAANPVQGAIYGAAGVGLREAIDQINKTPAPSAPPPPATPPTPSTP